MLLVEFRRGGAGIVRWLLQHVERLIQRIAKARRSDGAATQVACRNELYGHAAVRNWHENSASDFNLNGTVHHAECSNYVENHKGCSSGIAIGRWDFGHCFIGHGFPLKR